MEEITSSPPRITLQIGSKTNVQPAPMQPVNKAVPKPVRAPVQRTVTAEPRGLVLTKVILTLISPLKILSKVNLTN